MKKNIIFAARITSLMALFFCIYGCTEEKIAEARYLDVESPSGKEVEVPGEGGTIDIAVHTNLQWTISATEDGSTARWISFSETSGIGDGEVTATVTKGGYDPRTATITVMSKDETIAHSLTVNQASTGEVPEAEGYNIPAYSIFQNVSDSDVSLGIANATIEGATCKFDDGLSVTMSGENSTAVFNAGNYYQLNAKFTGWGAADAKDLIIRIPVKEDISGDMRMFWGWTSNTASTWAVSVSADGENWTDTGSKVSMTTGSRFNRDVYFTVPGTIPAGGALYMKLTGETGLGADDYVQFCSGFLLTRSKPDETPAPTGDKVLYYCNFDNVTDGCPYDMPLGYLRSSSVAFDAAAFGYDGIGKGGTVAGEWGSVRIGSASAAASLTFPPLSTDKLGEGTADVKVSFRAVLYQSADYLKEGEGKASCNIAVSVAEGEGEVENGAITDLQNWTSFEERSVVIKGVNKDTRIKIGISGG
ncbi:MAG: BACON domain-containing protein, partial [Candidatus Cryptobacteroides sp.]